MRVDLGRGQRDHRRRQRLHGQDLRPGPRRRLLADPGDVDGLLRRRLALSVAARRHLHVASTTGIATCRRPRPQTWGEQTDVPESADWYNSGFLILWGSNVPQTRTPDAHFYTEVRYKGAKSVVVSPGLFARPPSSPTCGCTRKQGTDAALAMAHGPRHPARSSTSSGRRKYFEDYCRQLHRHADAGAPGEAGRCATCPGGFCAPPTSRTAWARPTIPTGRRSPSTRLSGEIVVPQGSVGFRWGEQGKWNIEEKNAADGAEIRLRLSLDRHQDARAAGAFPYFGGRAHEYFAGTDHPPVLSRNVPVKRSRARRTGAALGRHGVRPVGRQLRHRPRLRRRERRARPTTTTCPTRRPGRRAITGVPRDQIISVAREFAKQRREDRGPVDGHPRRRPEPLVPHGHGLPRHHQHAGDVRLRRPVRRRLVALRRPGEAAAADRLAAARLRARLAPAAAAHELAPRSSTPTPTSGATRRSTCAEILSPTRRPGAVGRQPDRLQRPRRAHGLAAVLAAARDQSAGGLPSGRGGRQGAEGLCRSSA